MNIKKGNYVIIVEPPQIITDQMRVKYQIPSKYANKVFEVLAKIGNTAILQLYGTNYIQFYQIREDQKDYLEVVPKNLADKIMASRSFYEYFDDQKPDQSETRILLMADSDNKENLDLETLDPEINYDQD